MEFKREAQYDYAMSGSCSGAMDRPVQNVDCFLNGGFVQTADNYRLHHGFGSTSSSEDSADFTDGSELNADVFADAMRLLDENPSCLTGINVDEMAAAVMQQDSLEQCPCAGGYREAAGCPMGGHCNMYPDLPTNPCYNYPLNYHPPSPTGSNSSMSGDSNYSISAPTPPRAPRRTKASKGTASKHTLPDFMRQIIQNEQFNPKIIKWLNEDEGIFLIVKPKIIAQLWGERKGNPKMNYPSMSRGIRERRKYGYFDRVPQDPRYPKKLTYKFGPMMSQHLKC